MSLFPKKHLQNKQHQNTNSRKGFTLLELTISLGIFMIFSTAVISTFLSVTQASTKANLNREQVAESTEVLNYIESIAKENGLDYNYLQTSQQTPSRQTFAYISPDFLTRYSFLIECPANGLRPMSNSDFCTIYSNKTTRSNIIQDFVIQNGDWVPLHSNNLKIIRFTAQHFPNQDPFTTSEVVTQANQFQPTTHITLNLARNYQTDYSQALSSSNPIVIQTSISSRLYNSQ